MIIIRIFYRSIIISDSGEFPRATSCLIITHLQNVWEKQQRKKRVNYMKDIIFKTKFSPKSKGNNY